ncbi:hypothetical protein FKM82_016357 [Ascaphus truei]
MVAVGCCCLRARPYYTSAAGSRGCPFSLFAGLTLNSERVVNGSSAQSHDAICRTLPTQSPTCVIRAVGGIYRQTGVPCTF